MVSLREVARTSCVSRRSPRLLELELERAIQESLRLENEPEMVEGLTMAMMGGGLSVIKTNDQIPQIDASGVSPIIPNSLPLVDSPGVHVLRRSERVRERRVESSDEDVPPSSCNEDSPVVFKRPRRGMTKTDTVENRTE